MYKELHILNVYSLMSLGVIRFSSAGKHASRRLEFFMPAYSELNNVVIKEGLDTLKNYMALKRIPYLSYHALFSARVLKYFLRLNEVNLSRHLQ